MVEVRVLGPEDWQTWREVRLRSLQDSPGAFGSTYERELAFDEATWTGRLADPGSVSVLACQDGRAVGIGAGFSDVPGFLHVVAMWVEPDGRGHGIAHDVLRALRSWAEDRRLRLHLDVVLDNVAARHTYERFGFVGTGELRPLRPGSEELLERLVL